ncbi:MAG: HAMP domain-containing protein [Ardenticatenaceae bacterium]|nr:HAMP domain-containing protein [Ardenticatenaceae bacterium]MCB9004098.1 HAMP domain-containing protein [Ardenticatenaceae bacterium]
MIQQLSQNRLSAWFNQAPWRILATGMVVALLLAALLMWQLMRAPSQEIAALVITLATTSLISLGLGYVLYRQGWNRFPTLSLTLMMTYVWAALLTLFNVWVMAQQMFASPHDLLLSGVLLLFAAIIATTYGVFVTATVTDSLRQLAGTAQQLADGDLTARVQVNGRDEVARVAESFNEMAVQLQQAAQQQEELELLRRDLIAWTSHDLRTPLTSIRAMIEALHDGLVQDPDSVQRYYRTIRADVMALNTLIDDLFELAQLDAGGLVLDKSPYDITDLISDTLESFQALAGQRQISLTGEVGKDMIPVLLNVAKMSRVLANLVSNALRYTPPGGHVHVAVARVPDGVQVTVQDSGPGFKPQDLPRIFEQFYRGEQARSRATGGAGLGLAIARGIVEAHNGRIWAKNLPEGGALVGFILPLA